MPEPPASPPSKPRRRRFALSLRALMLLVLVAGGWLGWQARRASIQRRAVAEIKATGGAVFYDYMMQGGRIVPGASPWAPAWLRGAVGDEFFQEPRMVFLDPNNDPGGRQPTEATVAAVASLDGAVDLNSYRVPIGDAGFARLASMSRLKSCCLLEIDVTDGGLGAIASSPALEVFRIRVRKPGRLSAKALEQVARQPRLTNLEILNIDLPDPASLAPLAKLTRLEYLRLWNSPADDACLEHLKGLAALKRIDLRDTKLTDDGLDRIAGLANLESLLIDCSRLTDAGAAKLARFPKLNDLWVQPATQLSDVGLASLGTMLSLAELNLPGSNVTDAGLERLSRLKLQSLSVSGRGVTDAGLAGVASTSRFRDLALTGTGITSAGLAALAGQSQLRTLSLDRTKVDDSAAAALAALPALEVLILARTPLTDAGLLALARGAPKLTYLDVAGTRITARGLAAARAARPGLEIEPGPLFKLRQAVERYLPAAWRK